MLGARQIIVRYRIAAAPSSTFNVAFQWREMPEALNMSRPAPLAAGPSSDGRHQVKVHPKYRSLLERLNARIAANDTFFSLEFFPPRSSTGAVNLVKKWVAVNCVT